MKEQDLPDWYKTVIVSRGYQQVQDILGLSSWYKIAHASTRFTQSAQDSWRYKMVQVSPDFPNRYRRVTGWYRTWQYRNITYSTYSMGVWILFHCTLGLWLVLAACPHRGAYHETLVWSFFSVYSNIDVHTSTYKYIHGHTCTFWYIPECAGTNSYVHINPLLIATRCLSIYLYILVHTYIPVCTATYWYTPVHTISYNLIPLGTVMYCHVLLGTGLYSSRYQRPKFSPFSISSGTSIFPASCRPVPGRTRRNKAFVRIHSGIQESREMLGTSWHWDEYQIIYFFTYQYKEVHTSTY